MSAHIKWYNAEAEYVHRLARGLAKKGHYVLLWGRKGSPLMEAAEKDGIETVDFGDPVSYNPAVMLSTADELTKTIKQRGIEIVNAHRSEGFPLVARASKRAGAKVVRTRADMRMPKLAWLNGLIYGNLADLVITSNDLLARELRRRLGLSESFVKTIRMGIDPAQAAPSVKKEEAKEKLGLSSSTSVVAIMGRLGPVKGQEFVLRAAPDVIKEFPGTKFLVIYRDVEESDKFLPELERSEVKDDFVLVGPSETHREKMAAADVAVIPSVGSEAHCRVALEWMALSVPVVGSRVGVIPELIEHGDTGFLVQPRYSSTFGQCIKVLLGDPDRASLMGEAGREKLVSEFSEERMVEENEKAMQSLLDN